MQLFYGRFSSKKTEKCSIQIKIVNLWLLWNSSFRIEAQIHETRLTNPIWNVALIRCEKGKGNRSRMSTVQLRHFPITCTRAIRQIQSHNWLHNSVSGTNWKDQIRHWTSSWHFPGDFHRHTTIRITAMGLSIPCVWENCW